MKQSDIKKLGISANEFKLIKDIINFDSKIFDHQIRTRLTSPHVFTVDMSKYETKDIPQHLRDIFFRPEKIKKLYYAYWAIASDADIE